MSNFKTPQRIEAWATRAVMTATEDSHCVLNARTEPSQEVYIFMQKDVLATP